MYVHIQHFLKFSYWKPLLVKQYIIFSLWLFIFIYVLHSLNCFPEVAKCLKVIFIFVAWWSLLITQLVNGIYLRAGCFFTHDIFSFLLFDWLFILQYLVVSHTNLTYTITTVGIENSGLFFSFTHFFLIQHTIQCIIQCSIHW